MMKQIVTIMLGAVVMLGTATTLFAQNGLPTGGYPRRRGWQSRFCTGTGSVRSYVRSTPTSHDQAPQKDLYVSETLEEWLLTILAQSVPDFVVRGPFQLPPGFA
jgi:hypothetical protein